MKTKIILLILFLVVFDPSKVSAINGLTSSVKYGEGSSNGPTGINTNDRYGRAIAKIGDLDNDGVQDIAVGSVFDETGAATDAGAIFIHFMNSDGSFKSTVKIGEGTTNGPTGLETSDGYGIAIAALGDLDLDGVPDIAVGAHLDETGATANTGALYIHFMNADASIKSTVKIGKDTVNGATGILLADAYGGSIYSLGDLNGDGVQDIAVSAVLSDHGAEVDTGCLYIHFMNTNGSIDSTVKIDEDTANGPTNLEDNDNYGITVANIGDLNQDGVIDVAVGAYRDEAGATADVGTIIIHYMNTDGSIDSTVKIGESTLNGPTGLEFPDFYGSSIVSIGDQNNDGVQDLAVGSFQDEFGATDSAGAIFIHFMNTDASIDSTLKIGQDTVNGPTGLDAGDTYGISLALVGDYNGDGISELAVGSSYDETGATASPGAIFIHTLGISASGNIFSDLDNDGVDDGVSELGIANVTVRAWHDVDNDGVIDTLTDKVFAGATTDQNGNYTLYLPPSNDYLIDVYDANNALNGRYYHLTSANEPQDITVAINPIATAAIGYSLSGTNDGSISSTVKIGEGTANGPTGLSNGDFYGWTVAGLGDLNGDGVQDLAIGAPIDEAGMTTDTGAVYFHLMNSNGSISSSVKIGEGTANGPTGLDFDDRYGRSVSSIGDLDGDGVTDIVVGASSDENGVTGTVGAIYLHYLNSDGSIKSTVKIGESSANGPVGLETGDAYGFNVASIGDLNGDGVQDIAVGAPVDEASTTANTGAFYIHFMNIDGSINSTVKIGEGTLNGPTGLDTADLYGGSIATLGDLNGDGVQDLVVGAYGDENGSTVDTGAIFIHFMNTDGSIDSTVKIAEGTANGPTGLESVDVYGHSVALLGDLNGDGVQDIIVGAYGDENATTSGAGAVYIHFMNIDGSIVSTVKIGEGTTNGPFGLEGSDLYGTSLSVIGDLNGDGLQDIVIGSPVDETGMTFDVGAIYIHYLNNDIDGDGTINSDECLGALGNTCVDTDGDGTPDYLDTDSDGDGKSDQLEGNVDQDNDGLPDRVEPNNRDTDGDGTVDEIDPDSDGDSIDDGIECTDYRACEDTDNDLIPDYLDPDSDGSPSGGGDSDGDGIVDNIECPSGITCPDSDNDSVPNYTDPDSDNDGISDHDECINGAPCPDGDDDGDEDYIDPDTFGEILPISPTFVKWNTFLNQWNFLELSADGTGSLSVQIRLYNLSGALMLTRDVTIQGNNQIDVNIHELVKTACNDENPSSCNGLVDIDGNGIVDSYGLIGLVYTGTPRLVGRLTNYKINADGNFSFAFARELRTASTGNTYAVANTFDPQSRGFIVPNFGELIHIGDSDDAVQGNPVANGGYTVNIYDIGGVLIQSRHIVLRALQEYDFATGHEYLDDNGDIIQSVYLVEVTPDNPASEYQFSVARYSSNSLPNRPSDIYNYAMAVPGRRATAESLYATASNQVTSCGTVTNWVEVANVTASSAFVTIKFRNESGQTVSTSTDLIAAKSQYHYNASSQLPAGSIGSVEITSTTPDSVVAQSMVYVHECDANQIQTAYVSVARKQGRAAQVGTFNTFIGMSNALNLTSTISSSQNYTAQAVTYDGSSFLLNPSLNSRASDSLDGVSSFGFPVNKYGKLTVTSVEPGAIIAEVLRIRPVVISGQTRWDFVIPTEVK